MVSICLLPRVAMRGLVAADMTAIATSARRMHRYPSKGGAVGGPGSGPGGGGPRRVAGRGDRDTRVVGEVGAAKRRITILNRECKPEHGLIGLRQDVTHALSPADPIIFRMAVEKPWQLPRTSPNGQKNKRRASLSNVMPMFGTIPALRVLSEMIENDLDMDFSKFVLDEHYFQLYRPLPLEGSVHSIVELADITDCGSGSLYIFDVATRNENDDHLMFNQFCYLVNGDEVGRKRSSARCVATFETLFEDFPPQYMARVTTAPEQMALVQRLTGGLNPLLTPHEADAEADADEQHMHQLSTVAIVSHDLKQAFGIQDETFKGVKVRYSSPLTCGDTMQISAWRCNPHLICFNTMCVETGQMIHTGGCLTLY